MEYPVEVDTSPFRWTINPTEWRLDLVEDLDVQTCKFNAQSASLLDYLSYCDNDELSADLIMGYLSIVHNDKFFIAIGPPKTGTSWLYSMLKQHPDIFLPPDKEIRYFWAREFLGECNLTNKVFGKHWHYREKRRYLKNRLKNYISKIGRGKINFCDIWWDFRYFFFPQNDKWYGNLFDKNKLSGDITPKYCELSETVIKNIKGLNPDTKIIISLRSPVDRDWSRAKMNLMKKKGVHDYKNVDASLFKKHFKNDLQHQSNDYVNLVKRWKKYFPNENVFVFFYDELLNNPQSLLKNVCNFLEIKPIEFRHTTKKVNKGIEQEIPDAFKKQLIDLNYPFLAKMPEYFESEYPAKWLNKVR